MTYARCFNSGQRTRLGRDGLRTLRSTAEEIVDGRLLHDKLMEARNEHIAHAALKFERSILGCSLVEDLNYGKRPNMIITGLALRRNAPTNEKLLALHAHCLLVAKEVIQPKLMKTASAMREQLLMMPKEQFEGYPDFDSQTERLNDLF